MEFGYLNYLFDFVLVAMSIWMIVTLRQSGLAGVVGGSLSLITVGAVILGCAHLIETITFEMVGLQEIALGEFLHRLVVFLGFIFLILGFRGLGKMRRPA